MVRRHRRPSGASTRSTASSTSCVADDLRTVLWPIAGADGDADWELRAHGVGATPDVLLGGSDAGAHLDRMCGIALPDAVPRRLLPGPQARPARAGGAADHRDACARCSACATGAGCVEGAVRRRRRARPRDRGRRAGPTLVADLPGGSPRLTAAPSAWCACSSTAWRPSRDGQPTGALPGTCCARAATPTRSPPAEGQPRAGRRAQPIELSPRAGSGRPSCSSSRASSSGKTSMAPGGSICTGMWIDRPRHTT